MELTIPIRTVSEANQREHWSKRHKRRKAQRKAAYMLTPKHELPCVVTLTRIAPRMLDRHDGLPISLKATVDGIADRLGIDDADPRVTWRYGQEKGKEYAVKVEIAERETV